MRNNKLLNISNAVRTIWTAVVLMGLALSASSCGCSKPELRAGLRSSSYGISPFPPPDWWLNATSSMTSSFDDASPSVVWIVGVMAGFDHCWLNFPGPSPDRPDYILFSSRDANEDYLNTFDEHGVKVWLQVESGNADIPTLIDLVLERYASHPSVVGFGVDVEWYQVKDHSEGKAVTDEEAQAWSEQIRSYNPDYRLFLKHWLPEKMPPTYHEGMTFLDDSQQFESLDQMVGEFEDWGARFDPAPVGFQYGYPADRAWWGELSDPPGDIGRTLIERIPNATDLYWVDFTAKEIWPHEGY